MSDTLPRDAETRVAERPAEHEAELRLWLRLLTCTTLIEGEIRRRLRDAFDVTLPRFDLMAQLDKVPGGLTRALAQETAATGVTVNAVCPGFTDTDLVRRSTELIAAKTGRSPADALGAILKDKPLGRLIAPQEVAAAVLFLCMPQASAITGTALAIAGGEV